MYPELGRALPLLVIFINALKNCTNECAVRFQTQLLNCHTQNWLQRRHCTRTGYSDTIAHKLATSVRLHTNWLQQRNGIQTGYSLGIHQSCLNLGTGQKPVPLSYTFDGRHIFPVLQLSDGSSRSQEESSEVKRR